MVSDLKLNLVIMTSQRRPNVQLSGNPAVFQTFFSADFESIKKLKIQFSCHQILHLIPGQFFSDLWNVRKMKSDVIHRIGRLNAMHGVTILFFSRSRGQKNNPTRIRCRI